MTSTDRNAAATDTKSHPVHRRRWLAMAGIAAIALIAVLLYGAGFASGRAGLDQQKADLAQTQQQLAVVQSQSRLLVARGWLYRAALDLDQRNFGTASGDVSQASKALATVDPASAGVDPGQLRSLQQALAATDLGVATDVGAQRGQMLALANRVNAIIPPQVAEVAAR